MPFGTQSIVFIRTHFPIRRSGGGGGGGGGGGASPAVIVHEPGYGHHTADASAHIDCGIESAPGEVPEEYFPRGTPSRGLMDPRRVSFASGETVLGGRPQLDQSTDIQIHDPVCPDITEEDEMDIMNAEPDMPFPVLRPPPGFRKFSWPREEMDIMNAEPDMPFPVLRPPPGFRKFSWPREEWGPDGDPYLLDFSKELPGWFPWGYKGHSVDPPSLPISPILQNSLDDSVIANVGSSREQSNTPSEAVIATQTVVDALPVGMDSGPDVLADSPSPAVHRPSSGSPVGAVADLPNYLTSCEGRRSPGLVPRWRLAREGPFLADRLSSSLRCFGAGCSFRSTTYRPSDYASPSGEFGVPLYHPRFLEWIGVPESAGLLEMGPGRGATFLSRDQAMDAAIQLHQDVCLMTTNLDVLDQYALSLQGTASKILELGLDPRGFRWIRL